MLTDAFAVLLPLVDADIVDVSAVCLLVVVCADAVVDAVDLVVVVVLVRWFVPFLPDVIADNDEVHVEDEEKAVLAVHPDVLQ